MENEEYREVKGFEGLFVSNFGNIKTEKEFKVCKDTYPSIVYDGTKLYIHKLIATTFQDICGAYYYGYDVHHIDKNRNNNRADNLMCLPHKEHSLYHKSDKVGACKNVSVIKDGVVIRTYNSQKELLENENITQWQFYRTIQTGEPYNGLLFKY